MRNVFGILLVCLGLLVSSAGVATARTPQATKTPTATTQPTATSTPSPQQIARFHGEAWVDGQVALGRITAKIGPVVCGIGGIPGADVGTFYQIGVVSSDVIPGCGSEGNHVTFMIGDRQATETAIWRGGSDTALNLMAGAPFALFTGKTSLTCEQRIERQILPFIDDVACGQSKVLNILGPPCSGQLMGYTDIVFSALQKAGCGVEGSQITFKLLDAQGNIIGVANQTGVWHAWDGVSLPQKIDLTFVPVGGIRVGNTGTGDASDGEGNAWGRLSILLGFVGLTGAALGLALRRQAMTRQ